jgi:hypothetical protein
MPFRDSHCSHLAPRYEICAFRARLTPASRSTLPRRRRAVTRNQEAGNQRRPLFGRQSRKPRPQTISEDRDDCICLTTSKASKDFSPPLLQGAGRGGQMTWFAHIPAQITPAQLQIENCKMNIARGALWSRHFESCSLQFTFFNSFYRTTPAAPRASASPLPAP